MDPVTLDICWNRLVGVVNEQAAALMRTSFISIVREAGDLSAGVFDRRGFMVAQAVTGTPGHINSMALAMKHVLAAYPLETLEPGDVLITKAEQTLAPSDVVELRLPGGGGWSPRREGSRTPRARPARAIRAQRECRARTTATDERSRLCHTLR